MDKSKSNSQQLEESFLQSISGSKKSLTNCLLWIERNLKPLQVFPRYMIHNCARANFCPDEIYSKEELERALSTFL